MPPTPFTAAPHTLRNVRRDFPEWHRGRPRYALWAIDVGTPEVRQRVAAAQSHLAGLLLDDYCRQPHVTLSLCGFPQAGPPATTSADDFGPPALQAQLAALAAARPAAFELQIGNLASFSSAPYLPVSAASGHFASLRDCLETDETNRPQSDYVAHVTVGLYSGAWPTSAVQTRLDGFAGGEPLRLTVSRISLMTYASEIIGGPLLRVADYDFARRSVVWHAALWPEPRRNEAKVALP